MLKIILEAAENFCIHQIREPYTISNNIEEMRTIVAYIDIKTASNSYRVFVASSFEFAQIISTLLLEELESDDETLKDMTLELSNLIAGSAKSLVCEDDENHYTIKTPFFEKIGIFDIDYDEAATLSVKNSKAIIAIKEL